MLTLQISVKIEDNQLDPLINFLNVFSTVVETKVLDKEDKKFDWNAETVIAEKEESLEPYYKIADELYSKLLGDNRSFSDWEYKFISSNYEVAEAKGYYTPKQREWLKKLEEKYL